MHQQSKQVDLRELIILALLSAITCVLIAWLQPNAGSPAKLSLPDDASNFPGLWLPWVFVQAFCIAAAVVLVGAILDWLPLLRTRVVIKLLLLLIPVVMVCDSVMFRWTGERFLSTASAQIAVDSATRLATYLSHQMMVDGAILTFVTAGILAILTKSSRFIAKRLPVLERSPKNITLGIVGLPAIVAVGLLPFQDPDAALKAMASDSPRHPFCVFRLVSSRGVNGPTKLFPARNLADTKTDQVLRRQFDQRIATVEVGNIPESQSDLLIVIIESFRRELISKEIMPNLWALASNSWQFREHFSGGNATNHGMFCLFNGLEACWYQQPVTYTPLLNRMFHAAGYEIGFFAGHNDWRNFMMDGFVDPKHYDRFQCLAPSGLSSDRQSIENALAFLDRHQEHRTSKPRVAVLYLYSTHALYQSYNEDQIFQPAADERLTYPYQEQVRDQVWNRYKNSARTMDRFLSKLMRDDIVTLIVGDHGESFLEDGTIGHGIRISEYQNMTPAILHWPDRAPRVIDYPTSHIDLLPTLLAGFGIQISHPNLFDGKNLFVASDLQLANRVFATRNYLGDDYGLIGPWTRDPAKPFAYRVSFTLLPPATKPLNAIDSFGYADLRSAGEETFAAIEKWLAERSLGQARAP